MKTQKPKMNVRLLRKIQRAIMAEPKRMDMGTFASTSKLRELPPCGTVGCIAGWGVILDSGKQIKVAARGVMRTVWGGSIDKRAAKVLGISNKQGWGLFYISNWPIEFEKRIDRVKRGTKAYALVVCQRIDHFIKTGK